MENFDVVIIGGGLTGLTAAVYLGENGLKVAVIEKGNRLGGRASTKEIAGSLYNLGPHAFYKKGAAVKTLENIGVSVGGGSPSLSGNIFYENEPFELPSSFLRILRTKLLTFQEKKEFIQLMLKIGTLDPSRHSQQTLKQWAEFHIKSKVNQLLFYSFCRLASYVNAPELVDAGVVLRQLKLSLGGAIYVNRGWQSIIDKLKEKGTKLGVQFIKDSRVKEVDDANVIYLRKGEIHQLQAKWVISTVPPKEVLGMVKGIENSKLANLLSNCIPVKASCLDVTLSQLTDKNLHFSLDMNQSLYYSNHSHSSKLTYHPSYQVIHVMKYLRPEESVSTEQELETFLEKNQPGWKNYIVSKRYSPNLIVSYRYPTVGAEDIMEHAIKEFPGLIVAGEWFGNHSLLAEAAVQSAKIAVEKITATRGV